MAVVAAVACVVLLLLTCNGSDAESGLITKFFAHHQTPRDSDLGYNGVIVLMDVYGLHLSDEQSSMASVWLRDEGDGALSSLNAIQIGWEVSPRLYGDSLTHLGAYWPTDGFQNTSCHNTNCTVGFQPENGAPIGLGDVIQALSQPRVLMQNITLKVTKDGTMGDWMVYYGHNQDDLALIGRFPRSLFTGGMADRASGIRIGGYVSTRTTDLAYMGSGYLPNIDVMASASISN